MNSLLYLRCKVTTTLAIGKVPEQPIVKFHEIFTILQKKKKKNLKTADMCIGSSK